jgi:uncharacterized protein YfbU (UPF0304 family)
MINPSPFDQIVDPFTGVKKEEVDKYFRKIDEETRNLVIAVFANPHGIQLLDRWDDLYVRQPVCPPGSIEGYGYKREGENAFIIKIRSIVNNAQKVSL